MARSDLRRADRWRTRAIVAAAVLPHLAPPAFAQEAPNPLQFLRPWLEQKLGVPADPPAAPAAPAAAPAGPAQPETPAAEAAPPVGPSDPAAAAQPDAPAAPGGSAEPLPAPTQPVVPPTETGGPSGQGATTDPVQGAPGEAPAPPGNEDATSPGAPPDAQPAPPAVAEPTAAAVEAPPLPLHFGVLAGRDVTATMAALEPVAASLAQILGRQVEFLPLTSFAVMMDAQGQRRIDGGFYSAAAFASLQADCNCLEPIAAPAAADGTHAYYAVVVARADSGIGSVADLQGKTVAMGPEDSIGARRLQLAGLLAEGIDPGLFGTVREVASAEEAVRLVASGGADAAFAWSSMSGDPEAGYSRGTLADMVARGELSMNQIAVVWRSAPISHGPFAVLATLAEADKSALESYLLALEGSQPAAYDMLNPFYSGGYVAVDPEDYAGLDVLSTEDLDAVSLPKAPLAGAGSAAE